MFALAPSLVAGPKEVLTNRAPVESALPAQFAEETLRVAVYAEDNTSLPIYASGGVSTAHHDNLIQFLDANGYAVTALSTQDILDRKLMTADFDVFVLPNNVPKDGIVDLVMDYWLGGGGILSFDSGLGFMYYQGMIVPGETGSYGLLNVDVIEHWGFDYVSSMIVGARHSSAKEYQQDEVIVVDENTTIHDVDHFAAANSEDFVPLLLEPPFNSVGFALDNTARQGGRIVQLPGNCSVIPAWESSVIIDSIDWLTPRPKGRILVDLDHGNWIPLDSWDPYIEYYPLDTWRNSMVNHSYTVDKSHSELTADSLALYDMLVILMPNTNFTAAEVEAVRAWVMNGGSLFVIGDTPNLGNVDIAINDLISPFDISFNLTAGDSGFGATCVPTADLQPLHESALYLEMGDGGFLNITGDAYPIWMFDGNIMVAGHEYGEGRVIVNGDGNMAADGLEILLEDNYQYLLNVANWLTAAKAEVLVYADYFSAAHPNVVALNGPVAQALNDLGIAYYMTSDLFYFNMSLFADDWDMVVFDNSQWGSSGYQPHLVDFVAGGGKLIFSTWGLNPAAGDYFGVGTMGHIGVPTTVLISEPTHPIFNLPAPYGADNLTTTLDLGFGTDALNLTVYANATALAGYEGYTGAAITLGAEGNVIFNGPLLTIYNDDTDDSTYPDNLEIWENEIAFLYFDRPTIDHPADVTYMQTETGNEIIWHPTADAGPWEYVFSVNGTPVEGGRWTGAPLAFGVDGVNISITEYELTVFDRLGYSVSDLVTLNVTEYIEPTGPGGPPLDPTLLLIIGAAVAGVVIILVVIMQLKKKK
jgi:hypothetical protein